METTTQSRIGALQIGIIILTLAAAFIHLGLAFLSPDPLFTPLFILNCLGYLSLMGAYFLPITIFRERHNLVRLAYIAFPAVTILGWIVMGDTSWPSGALGYATKLIEITLIILLVIDGRQDKS